MSILVGGPCWKTGYASAAEAQHVRRVLTHRGRRLLVYRCRVCSMWHHRSRG